MTYFYYETYCVGVTSCFYQLGVPTSSFGMCPSGDATKERRERDAQKPGYRRQFGLTFGHHLARPVVRKIYVAQKQHRGQNPHHVHERNAEETFANGKYYNITKSIRQLTRSVKYVGKLLVIMMGSGHIPKHDFHD